MNKNLEGVTEDNYGGCIDKFYKKASKGIDKIPNRYIKDFIRGAVSIPFAFGMSAEIFPEIFKKDRSSIEKPLYSFASRMIEDRTNEIGPEENEIKTVFDFGCVVAGAGASAIGLLHLTSYFGPSSFYMVMGSGIFLDAANYIEQRIRQYKS